MTIEKIAEMERSKRRVILASMVVIAGIAMYQWILSPYSRQLLAADRYRTMLNSTMRKAGAFAAELRAKGEKVESMQKEYDRRQNELFVPIEAQKFFGSLQTIADSEGCVIQSVSLAPEGRRVSQNQPGEASSITGKKTIVTISGGYNEIVKFMNRLQSYERKIWIDSFRMETGGRSGKLKCQITLTLFCIERVEAI